MLVSTVLLEGSVVGEVSWLVDWSDTGLKTASVFVVFQHATFENGSVEWQLCAGDKCFMGNKGNYILRYTMLYCPILHCTVCCFDMLYNTVHFCAIPCFAFLFCNIIRSTVQFS